MTLYKAPRYSAWYQAVCREVFRRAHGICEVPGCGQRAIVCHHLYYPHDRREEPRDLEAVCHFHHWWLHHFAHPASRYEEAEQFDLDLEPANDNEPRKRDAG